MNGISKTVRRDALLGMLGALLMLVGDLCLSVIDAAQTDSGLFAREVYLSGSWEVWRLPLLLATGLCGMALGFFTVRVSLYQILPQYDRLMPAMSIAYAGMVLLILASAFAVLTGKTVLPRWMFALHMIVFQIIFVLIPDIRQALGAEISTWDFVLSQGSGNAALAIWMLANAVWAGRQPKNTEENGNGKNQAERRSGNHAANAVRPRAGKRYARRDRRSEGGGNHRGAGL